MVDPDVAVKRQEKSVAHNFYEQGFEIPLEIVRTGVLVLPIWAEWANISG